MKARFKPRNPEMGPAGVEKIDTKKVWNFGYAFTLTNGDIFYEAMKKVSVLRYRLMPYIYSTAWRVTNEGYSLMRAIPMSFPNDTNSYQIQTGVYNTKKICCTPENNVIKYSANTLLSQSYYSDSRAYLKARCKLYSQKLSINDMSGNTYDDPLIINNSVEYQTNNCSYPYQTGKSNTCNPTIYKPSNSQYATQGAVDNGTRLAKLKYDTITKNGASFRSAWGDAAANAGKYQGGYNRVSPYFLKSKYTPPLVYRRNGNKLICAGCTGGPRTVLSSFFGAIN